MNSPDPNKDKPQKWKANHLGTFVTKGSVKDATNAAFNELNAQLSNGKYRDLQCTINLDRNKRALYIKRWLDNVLLEEYDIVDISNVISYQEVPSNKALCNIVTFNTQQKVKGKESNGYETHIFQLEDLNLANYLASDIRSSKEACAVMRSNSSPIKVLPSNNDRNSGRFDNFDSIRQIDDITCKTERNLLLLNYCFDDMEFFIQHLKDQEEARELLKKKSTDRLLEGRAKPSTSVAYITCIQKIKFCFNLLSKLDGKIKNPDSHELSRVVMIHLIKIGQAYNIYHKGKLSAIKEPLLLQSAVTLLQNSLPKEHFRIWNGWGEFWIKPRERWAGYQEKYCPEFFNGYEVDVDEMVNDGLLSPSVDRPKSKADNSVITDKIYSNNQSPRPAPLTVNSNGDNTQLGQREEDFCRSVKLRGGKLYRVANTYVGKEDKELSVSEGEFIEVVESRPDRNWWLCTNMQGQRGYTPNTILEPFNYVDKAFNKPLLRGETISPPSTASGSDSLSRRKSVPLPSPKDHMTFEKSLEEAKSINDELKAKINSPLAFGNGASRASFARPHQVSSKNHSQITINQNSTGPEVEDWLKFKKFSDEDVEKFKEFTGQTLFLMTREQMNRIVGVDTGARLYSFMNVQKSLSGFGTMSRKELDDILLKRKNRVDYEDTI